MADRNVTVNLRANVDQYKRAMHDAGVTTKGLGTQVDQLGAKGSQRIADMTNGLVDLTGKTAAVAGGVALAGAAILKFANTGIDAFTRLADQVDTYQDITGASAEESSRMVAVANTLGVSTDALASGMFRLSRNIRTNADELKRYGIEAARNEDGSVNLSETLLRVSDAYNRVGGGAQGNAIAMAAFGRGGNQLIDILERSRTELEGFWAEAERNHQILSEDDLETARKYDIAMRELEMAWQGLAIAGAEVLLPTLIDIADALTTIIQKVNDLKDSPIADVLGVIAKGLPIGQAAGLLDTLVGGSDEAADSTSDLAGSFDDVEDAATKAESALADYSKQLADVLDRTFGADEAIEQISEDLARLAQDIDKAKEAGDKFATSLDASNTTGLANRQTLRDIAAGAGEVAEAMIRAGEDPTAAMQTLYAQLLNTLAGLGFNRAEASELLGVLLQFPSSIGVGIDIDISKAEAALARLMRLIAEAPLGVDALEAEKWVQRHGQSSSVTAGGSLLPTITPSFGGGSSRGSTKDPAEEALRRRLEEDARMGRMAEFGGITVDQYKAYLNARIAATAAYSEEWAGLMQELDRVNTEIGQSWLDAAENMKALEDAGWEVLARMNEVGDLSTDEYLKQLERRLKGLQKYSDEWMDTWREIQQLKDDITADELAIIEAVEKQRQYDMAFYDLVSQRALSDLRAVGQPPVVVQGGSTRTSSYSPQITVVTSDPARAGDSVNQRMRDDAFLQGL